MYKTHGYVNALICESCVKFHDLDCMPMYYPRSREGLADYAKSYPCRACGQRRLTVVSARYAKKTGWEMAKVKL